MPMLELAAGDQHEGIRVVGSLRRRDDARRNEAPLAARGRKLLGDDDALSRIVVAHAGLRQGVGPLEPAPPDAREGPHRPAQFRPPLRWPRIRPLRASPPWTPDRRPQAL